MLNLLIYQAPIIQCATSFSDLSPVERARTLSNKANKFDAKRLVGAKPEIKYRLTLVKKDNSVDSEGGKAGENG